MYKERKIIKKINLHEANSFYISYFMFSSFSYKFIELCKGAKSENREQVHVNLSKTPSQFSMQKYINNTNNTSLYKFWFQLK